MAHFLAPNVLAGCGLPPVFRDYRLKFAHRSPANFVAEPMLVPLGRSAISLHVCHVFSAPSLNEKAPQAGMPCGT